MVTIVSHFHELVGVSRLALKHVLKIKRVGGGKNMEGGGGRFNPMTNIEIIIKFPLPYELS